MNFKYQRQRRVRDFSRRQIVNPYFNHAKRKAPVGPMFKKLLLGVVVAGAAYGILYSPLFRITDIRVAGATTVDPTHVQAAARQALAPNRYVVLPGDLMFIADTDAVRSAVQSQFGLRSVTVKTKFRALQITIGERLPTYRLLDNGNAYLLDQDGVLLKAAEAGEGENLIALASTVQTTPQPNIAVFKADWLKFIDILHQHFATQVGVRDQIYKVDASNGSVIAVTVEGWEAIFDPLIAPEPQLASLATAVVSKFGPAERLKLQYVDVRFGDRLFYKMK